MFRAHVSLAAALALIAAAATFQGAQAQTSEPQPAPSQPAPSQAPPSDTAPAKPAESQQTQDDPFGQEIQLGAKTIIFMKGTANWDTAYETLLDSFKTIRSFLEKEGIKAAGPAMTVYLTTDDTGFEFRAAVPIAEPMSSPPRGDIEMGESPSGKMLKFVHRGSYDAMDSTYEAITNFLDTKQLEAQDTFIEEYITDPVTTPEDELVINVLVPVK